MRIGSFLLCDDIRNEVGGKPSLMGVFGEAIVLEVPAQARDQWPKALRLGIFVQMTLDDDDRNVDNLSFKIEKSTAHGQEKIGGGVIPLWKNKHAGKLNIALVHNPFLVSGVGPIVLKISCYGDDGKEITLHGNTISVKIEQRVISPQ